MSLTKFILSTLCNKRTSFLFKWSLRCFDCDGIIIWDHSFIVYPNFYVRVRIMRYSFSWNFRHVLSELFSSNISKFTFVLLFLNFVILKTTLLFFVETNFKIQLKFISKRLHHRAKKLYKQYVAENWVRGHHFMRKYSKANDFCFSTLCTQIKNSLIKIMSGLNFSLKILFKGIIFRNVFLWGFSFMCCRPDASWSALIQRNLSCPEKFAIACLIS